MCFFGIIALGCYILAALAQELHTPKNKRKPTHINMGKCKYKRGKIKNGRTNS